MFEKITDAQFLHDFCGNGAMILDDFFELLQLIPHFQKNGREKEFSTVWIYFLDDPLNAVAFKEEIKQILVVADVGRVPAEQKTFLAVVESDQDSFFLALMTLLPRLSSGRASMTSTTVPSTTWSSRYFGLSGADSSSSSSSGASPSADSSLSSS